MKNLLILLAVVGMSCGGSEKKPEVIEKIVPEVITDTVTVEKVIVEMESDKLQNDNVRKSFFNMVDAINNASPENVENLMAYLDKDYAFKGKDRGGNIERFTKLFTNFKFNIANVDIKSIQSSCDLAYLVVGFKKSITGRESGVESVKERNKVGLFIMKKNNDTDWKLLVQKTDDGFAHWFYAPE